MHVSFITELELIGFKQLTVKKEKQIQTLLDECVIISLNNEIKKRCVAVRRSYHLKLADAVIAGDGDSFHHPINYC